MRTITGPMLSLFLLAGSLAAASESYSWQQPHATVLPNGQLEWAPESFTYAPAGMIRYIDFAAGDDGNAGTRDAPWRHHPWDPDATGQARGGVADTYVFRGGVTYRGRLVVPADADAQLTCDPEWGEGRAWIVGSEAVGGWRKQAHAKMPAGGSVWAAQLDFLPRNAWMVDGAGVVTRLRLARIPNWEVVDPENEMSQWWTWKQPEWWKQFQGRDANPNKIKLKGKWWHLGIDPANLKAIGEAAVGGYVRTEWGVPTGNDPYPAEIHGYDAQRGGIAFGSPWNEAIGGNLFAGHRYFLEDRPQWLDQPGEFWFDRQGEGGTLYLRLPGDIDPKSVTVEAAKELRLIEASGIEKLEISGLGFRFTNILWDMGQPQYMGNDVFAGVIRLRGPAELLQVDHCRFEHVHLPLRTEVGAGQTQNRIRFTDNEVFFADHGVTEIRYDLQDRTDKSQGTLVAVDVLRNRVHEVGKRGTRGRYNAGIRVVCPLMAEIAGNIIDKTGSQGIEAYGGKLSGQDGAWPFSRQIVHHNQVTDSMQRASDWAGIELWQGGPFYVYNNNSGAPQGLMNWKDGGSRFGFAYYFDGGFKGYTFNNIAWARTDNEDPRLGSKAAFQTVLGMENAYFNNSIYNFKYGFHRQSPKGGRNEYLGNIFQDISEMAMKLANPGKEQDVNAGHFEGSDTADYATNAIVGNVFHAIADLGTYRVGGHRRTSLEDFQQDVQELGHTGPGDVGVMSDQPPMPHAAESDFRPAPGTGVAGRGVRHFVPWALSAVVGEWNFTPNSQRPDEITDDHWYMTRAYDQRDKYSETPRYPLTRSGGEFVAGKLESWCNGALRLAESDLLSVSHELLAAPYAIPASKKKRGRGGEVIAGADKPTVDMDTNDFLIEAYLRTEDGDGTLVAKRDGRGYALALSGGALHVTLSDGETEMAVTASGAWADGAWHHLLVEVDRDQGVRIYQDGEAIQVDTSGSMPTGSLANGGDFQVGIDHAGTWDFLRVARSTLADAYTTIDELYTWQLDGPQYRDFTGRPRGDRPTAGAIELE